MSRTRTGLTPDAWRDDGPSPVVRHDKSRNNGGVSAPLGLPAMRPAGYHTRHHSRYRRVPSPDLKEFEW